MTFLDKRYPPGGVSPTLKRPPRIRSVRGPFISSMSSFEVSILGLPYVGTPLERKPCVLNVSRFEWQPNVTNQFDLNSLDIQNPDNPYPLN